MKWFIKNCHVPVSVLQEQELSADVSLSYQFLWCPTPCLEKDMSNGNGHCLPSKLSRLMTLQMTLDKTTKDSPMMVRLILRFLVGVFLKSTRQR